MPALDTFSDMSFYVAVGFTYGLNFSQVSCRLMDILRGLIQGMSFYYCSFHKFSYRRFYVLRSP